MSKTLLEYLSELNCAETNQGLWVNPENINQYRIGSFQYDNDGIKDGWVCIGSLENLSFGYQDRRKAIESFLIDNISSIHYKDEKISVGELLDLYDSGDITDDALSYLYSQSDSIYEAWAILSAEKFINEELPIILDNN